jgi:hypothetical protein
LPVGEVGHDNRIRWEDGAVAVAGPVLRPDREAAIRAVVSVEVPFECAAADRCWHVQRTRDVLRRRLGRRLGEQRRVAAEHAEREAVWPRVFDAVGGCLCYRVRLQPPDEEHHARNVVLARGAVGVRAAHVDRMRDHVEGSVEQIERVTVAEVGGAATLEALVVERLRPGQQPVELDGAGRPARHIVREQFEQCQRALSAPVADGMRDVAARDEDLVELALAWGRHVAGLSGLVCGLVADQVAEVGHRPVLARFDEPVFVELVHIVFDDLDLFGDHLEQRPQRVSALGVAFAIDGG